MSPYCDNKEKYAYYAYDDAGQRTYKMTFNASYMANNHYGEYTKHYYAENQRIASKLGTGSIISANLCDIAYNYMSGNELNNLRDKAEDKIQQDLTFVVIPETWVNMDYLGYNICNLQGDIYQNEDGLFFYHGNHLSSTQMITDRNGNVVQQVHYAPFGEIISEYNAYWHGNLIPNYTFNAKELDEESGMYYFEARYLKPPSFISRDPLFEKKPWLNPYHYCGNNPVNRIDPTGMEDSPIYDTDGNHIGNTKEGFTGTILIYSGSKKNINFSKMSESKALKQKGVQTYDNSKANLADNARENIVNHVVSQAEGMQIEDKAFSTSDLIGGKVFYDGNETANWATYLSSGKITFNDNNWNYEATVENIQSTAIPHEWFGHKQKGYGDKKTYPDHYRAYDAVMGTSIYPKTTANYKSHVTNNRDYYFDKHMEVVGPIFGR